MEYMISELGDKSGGIMVGYAQKSYPDPCAFPTVRFPAEDVEVGSDSCD